MQHDSGASGGARGVLESETRALDVSADRQKVAGRNGDMQLFDNEPKGLAHGSPGGLVPSFRSGPGGDVVDVAHGAVLPSWSWTTGMIKDTRAGPIFRPYGVEIWNERGIKTGTDNP